jgi:hypothetical protein
MPRWCLSKRVRSLKVRAGVRAGGICSCGNHNRGALALEAVMRMFADPISHRAKRS